MNGFFVIIWAKTESKFRENASKTITLTCGISVSLWYYTVTFPHYTSVFVVNLFRKTIVDFPVTTYAFKSKLLTN